VIIRNPALKVVQVNLPPRQRDRWRKSEIGETTVAVKALIFTTEAQRKTEIRGKAPFYEGDKSYFTIHRR
jgi:hypothetical protein